jgi:protein gp37
MQNSKIEWTTHTFNPWVGCTKISPGCANCYAETIAARYWGVKWGIKAQRHRFSERYWEQPFKWNRKAKREGTRPRVFCASLADIFDEEVPNSWRDAFFNLIDKCPYLDWLLLTKRANKMADYMKGEPERSNVWLGVSAENQQVFDRRVNILLTQTRAVVRFVSMEPLLECVDISRHVNQDWSEGRGPLMSNQYLDWVIVGGESGPKSRPMDPEWVRMIRDQCINTKTAFLFKQWGEHIIHPDYSPSTHKTPFFKAVGKKEAGRLLDGQEWNQYP